MGQLRIVAGRLKGRRLAVPDVPGLRPTPERAREALFSILGDTLREARVLDAYAGTGALGLEAISRGAARVVFVERDPRAVRWLEGVLRRLELCSSSTVHQGDAVRVVADGRAGDSFDLILADPPYRAGEGDRFLPVAARRLTPGGILVLEGEADSPPPADAAGLSRFRTARYGRSRLHFFSAGADRP